jgi:hypothetical protein
VRITYFPFIHTRRRKCQNNTNFLKRKTIRVPEEERGCCKYCETGDANARECRVAIVSGERERERKREGERVIKEEMVWIVGSVVCKNDSHSLGNNLSFAKWIGRREIGTELISATHHAEPVKAL